jgi:hypothetical protein
MPVNSPSAPPDAPEDLTDDPDAYAAPEDFAETVMDDTGLPRQARAPRSVALRLAAVAVVVLAVGGALLAYRAHHRGKVLAEGLARADALLRLDTAAGYREAASLLEPLAELDAVEAASVRAFALAMLFADYRAADLEAEADALLVGPGRADPVPTHAHLAVAALALGRREAGTATTATARAGDGPWARTLQARIAVLAGNVAAALDPAAAAAAEGAFPPGLAVHGDALRRLRQNARAARAAYEAALAASPMQPRAAYGLAKLALGGNAPAAGATAALERLLDDAAGTPAPERARAALHLAALRLREGDRVGAGGALDRAALDPPARAWAVRAATVAAEHRGPYRAVEGAPPALQSASDDDPAVLSPLPPPPPRPAAKTTAKKASAKKRTATARPTAAKRKATATRTTTRRR